MLRLIPLIIKSESGEWFFNEGAVIVTSEIIIGAMILHFYEAWHGHIFVEKNALLYGYHGNEKFWTCG